MWESTALNVFKDTPSLVIFTLFKGDHIYSNLKSEVFLSHLF